jgi:4-amino-4-deoxy-L-arabinose transferase-like glycosyltransferase
MFDAANGGQIAWFLPGALLGAILCLVRWRDDRVRRTATALFLGWVLLFGLVFSYAEGIYHSYYTAAMAPGVAVLIGLTLVASIDLVRRDRFWILPALVPVAATVLMQLELSGRSPEFYGELRPYMVAIALIGGAAVAASLVRRSLTPAIGLTAVAAGLFLIPGAWATYEATHPSINTTLPQAGARVGAPSRSFGSQPFDSGVASLAAWLQSRGQQGTTWAITTSSAQQASTLIAEYGIPVLALGGFSGSDPTITASEFGEMVADGEVRYVLTGGGPGGGGFRGPIRTGGGATTGAPSTPSTAKGANAVMSAVVAVCAPVTGDGVPAQYANAIYDCAGKGDALKAR